MQDFRIQKIYPLFLFSALILFIFLMVLKIPLDPFAVLYGGNHEVQFLPWLQELNTNLQRGIYPFFSFEINFGQDILAESQQAAAHPIKLAFLFFGLEPWLTNSLFFATHLIILYFGVFLFCKEYLPSHLAIVFGLLGIMNTASIINVAHPHIMCPLAYFPYQLLLLKRFTDNTPFSISSFKFTLVTSLSLLCGHYQMQWLMLFTLLLYSFFRVKEAKTVLFYFLFSVALSFLFCSFQLLPTIGQVVESSRSGPGGLDKFVGSASPLTWLNYFSPTLGWEIIKFNYGISVVFGVHNLIENTHFLGTFPLVLFFAFVLRSRSEVYNSAQHHLSLLNLITVIKALGIFFFVNVLLNFLPIFGQFRIPARNLFLLDILLIFFLAANLKRINHEDIILSFKIILMFILICTFISIVPIYTGFKAAMYGYLPFTGEDILFILLPSVTTITLLILYKLFSRFTNVNILITIFSFLTLLELFTVGKLMPNYHYFLPKTAYEESQKKVDKFCRDNVDDKKVILEGFWPNFDKPIFWGEGSNDLYLGSQTQTPAFPLNGKNCNINHKITTATITQLWVSELSNFLFDLNLNERLWALDKMGFHLFSIQEKGEAFSLVANIKDNTNVDNSAVERALFNIVNKDKENLLWQSSIAKKFFLLFKRFQMDYFFPSKKISPFLLENEQFLPVASTFSYVLIDSDKNLIQYDNSKRLLKLKEGTQAEIEVVHIPVLFLLGFFVSVISLLLCFIIYFFGDAHKLGAPISRLALKINLSDSFLSLLRNSKILLKKYEKLLNYCAAILIILTIFALPILKTIFGDTKYDRHLDLLMMSLAFYFSFLLLIFYILKRHRVVSEVSLPIVSFLSLNLAFGKFLILLGVTPLYEVISKLLF